MSSPWVLGQRWHPRPSQPLHPTRCWSSTGTNITPVTKALGRIFGRDSALLECLTGTKSWPNSSVSWRQELQPHAGRSAGPGKWTRLVVSKPWRWLASLSGAVNFQEQPLLTPTQLHTSHPHPHPTISSTHLRCSGGRCSSGCCPAGPVHFGACWGTMQMLSWALTVGHVSLTRGSGATVSTLLQCTCQGVMFIYDRFG